MQVKLKQGAWVDIDRMRETIEKAGYGVSEGGAELRVTGKLQRADGRLGVALSGMSRPVVLGLGADKESPDLLTHLERHVGEDVDLEGRWEPAPKDRPGPGTLAVLAVHKTGR